MIIIPKWNQDVYNYRRPVEVLSAGYSCVVSSLSGSFTDSDSVSSYCTRGVASRSHAYYWRYTCSLCTINRRGSARLDIGYVAHVRRFISIFHISSRLLPDYSQFPTSSNILKICSATHPYLYDNFNCLWTHYGSISHLLGALAGVTRATACM